jgi:hypothetical protein
LLSHGSPGSATLRAIGRMRFSPRRTDTRSMGLADGLAQVIGD